MIINSWEQKESRAQFCENRFTSLQLQAQLGCICKRKKFQQRLLCFSFGSCVQHNQARLVQHEMKSKPNEWSSSQCWIDKKENNNMYFSAAWFNKRWVKSCLSSLFLFQRWRPRRTELRFSNSPSGGPRATPSQRCGKLTIQWGPNSTSCPSAPNSSPWRSSTTPNTAPSSTTRPSCHCTGGPRPSTGEHHFGCKVGALSYIQH